MRIVIETTEGMYGGLHGLSNGAVFEVDDMSEADSLALELGYDLVDSYECLSEMYNREDDPESLELDWTVDIVSPEFDNLSTQFLDTEYSKLGYDDFVDKYCFIRE